MTTTEILSELRSQYNCFDELEEPVYRALSEAIKAVSAQPDIIHCGKCRHFTIKGNIERVEFGKCSVIKSVCLREDYCSWAERKEVNDEDCSIKS